RSTLHASCCLRPTMPPDSCGRPHFLLVLSLTREAQMKCRTLTWFGDDPDAPAVALHDALDDRETDAVPLLDLTGDQLVRRPVVQLKNPAQLTGFDADAVVPDVVLDPVSGFL